MTDMSLQLTNETNTPSQHKQTVNGTHLYVLLGLFPAQKKRSRILNVLFKHHKHL
jgi:hypothetical protein